MALRTSQMPFAGAPQTGSTFWDRGFLYVLPSMPATSWSYPIRIDMYLEQTGALDRIACNAWLMDSAGTVRGTSAGVNAEFNFPDTAAWVNFSVGNFGPVPPEPRYVGLLSNGAAWTRDRVRITAVTVTYTVPDGPGDAGTIEITKRIEGAALPDLVGAVFPIVARNDSEEVMGAAEVTWREEIEQPTLVISRGLVTFEELTESLPAVVAGRRAAWRTPVFDPPFVEVNPGGVYQVTVTNRVFYPGGIWNTRQRQGLSGTAGGWPLRQRQNGGATGSWPLRQRQSGM